MATPRSQNGRATWLPYGIDSVPLDGNRSVLNQASSVLTAADSGKTFSVSLAGTTTYTLPATAPGLVYTMAYVGNDFGNANNPGAGTASTLQFAPNAADGISGAGAATVINKALILAAATIRKGDYVTIASLAGTAGVTAWHVIAQHGVLTKQP